MFRVDDTLDSVIRIKSTQRHWWPGLLAPKCDDLSGVSYSGCLDSHSNSTKVGSSLKLLPLAGAVMLLDDRLPREVDEIEVDARRQNSHDCP